MGEFFGFGEDLKDIRYNVPWQVGFLSRAFGFIPCCRPEPSPVPLLNPSSRWYNPLDNNDKPAQEDEES